MIDGRNITGIILAGGKSSRMGKDKGFLMLNNKPFVQYIINALKPLVKDIMIVSDNPNYAVFGIKQVNDRIKNAGPVAGIYSGLKASSNEYNLILSCDIPLITSEILQKLIANIDNTSQIIQIESNGKSMPLIGLYKKDVLNTFDTFLKNNERRLRTVIKNCKSKTIILEKKHEFSVMNVNTKTELNKVKDVYNH